jgi:hypothetical protein
MDFESQIKLPTTKSPLATSLFVVGFLLLLNFYRLPLNWYEDRGVCCARYGKFKEAGVTPVASQQLGSVGVSQWGS